MDPDVANIKAEAESYLAGLQRYMILNEITPPSMDLEITEQQKKAWEKRVGPLMTLGEMTATVQYDPQTIEASVTLTADQVIRLLNGGTINITSASISGLHPEGQPLVDIKIVPKEVSDELRDAQSGDGGQRDGQGHRGGAE